MKAGRYISLVAPTALLLSALSIWFATTQINKVISTGAQSAANAITKNQPPKMNKRNMDAAGYAEVVNLLSRGNPAVRVQLGINKDSIVVSVADPEQMPEWVFLLSTLQSYRPGLIWTAERICLKKMRRQPRCVS
ncbi:hypothetical protein ACFS07_32635 [Undibacterium arcticum]